MSLLLLFQLAFLLSFVYIPYGTISGVTVVDKIFFIGFALALFIRSFKQKFTKNQFFIFCVAVLWVVLMLVGTLRVQFPLISLLYVLSYSIQVLLFIGFVLLFNDTPIHMDRLIKVLYFWGLVIAVVGIVEYYCPNLMRYILVFRERTYDGGHAATSFFDNPNPFGVYSSLMIGLGFYLKCRGWLKHFFLHQVILSAAVVVSGSRNALLVALLSWVLSSLYSRTHNRLIPIAFIVMIPLLIVGAYCFVLNSDKFALASFTGKRSVLWIAAFDAFKSSPWLGIGNGNFQNLLPTLSGGYFDLHLGLHSLYLWSLAETGMITSSVFCILLISTLRSMIHKLKYNPDDGYLIVTFGALLLSQISEMHLTHIFPIIILFWMLLASALGSKQSGITLPRHI